MNTAEPYLQEPTPESVLLRALQESGLEDFELIYRGLYSPTHRIVVELLSTAEMIEQGGSDGDAQAFAIAGVSCLQVPEFDLSTDLNRTVRLIQAAVAHHHRGEGYIPHWYQLVSRTLAPASMLSLGRVLLVDDLPEIRLLLRTRLEIESDLEVIGEASNGQEAVDLTELLAPDVVVLDIKMPVMRGDEAIPRLRAIDPDVGIVVYTGLGPDAVVDATAADERFVKGAPLGPMVAALREILARRPHDVLRLDLGDIPVPMVADGFDVMAGLLTRLVDTTDGGDVAVPALSQTTNADVRALLGIYAHLGYSLRRSARAGDASAALVVNAFRTQAAMARRALLAIDSAQIVTNLTDPDMSSNGNESTIRLVNSRLLAALPKSTAGLAEGGRRGRPQAATD